MALRDQPYIPLFVQDFLTDEKLMECSASATGVYVRILCLMHKSETYGKIVLKQKYKQDSKQDSKLIKNFACQLDKYMPYDIDTIEAALHELIEENVCYIEDDFLCQKRMIRDNSISEARSKAGKKGGGNPNFVKTKPQTNSEYEYEYEYENENKKGGSGGRTKKIDLPEIIIKEFQKAYLNCRGVDYIIANHEKERSAAGKLIQIMKNKSPSLNTQQMIEGMRAYFERVVGIDDPWLFTNMSLPIILSKINEINTILINGNKRPNSQAGATDRELAELLASKWANQ